MPRSFSQLQSYQNCPRQYEFAYIKKVPRGHISAGESFGSSMHNCLKKWGEIEMQNAKCKMDNNGSKNGNQLEMFEEEKISTSEELSVQLLIDLWRGSFIVEGYETRIEADMAMLKGEKILRMYYEWWKQSEHKIVAVEKGFKLEIDGAELAGRFDRVEFFGDGVKVIDYKTSVVRTQEFVDADLQLSVYALACEEVFHLPCTVLSFLFLREDGIFEVETHRNENQLQDAIAQIHSVNEYVESRNFRPTPSRGTCRKCPYKNVCDVAAT